MQVGWARHSDHCWRNKDDLINDILQRISICGHTDVGQPAKTYIQQFYAEIECRLVDLPRQIIDRDGWWKSKKSILSACHDEYIEKFLIKLSLQYSLAFLQPIHLIMLYFLLDWGGVSVCGRKPWRWKNKKSRGGGKNFTSTHVFIWINVNFCACFCAYTNIKTPYITLIHLINVQSVL